MLDIKPNFKPHSPLSEMQARENGNVLPLEEGIDIDPYEYKLISGVYFLRYNTKENGSLYDDKRKTFASNSYAMSICDERGFVYVGVLQDNDARLKIGRFLRNKGYSGFKDTLERKDGKSGEYNGAITGHMVPLSSEMGGFDKLIDATGRAHIFHTQVGTKAKAIKITELQKGHKI